MRPRRKPDARDVAAEIIRRVNMAQGNGGYVVRLSDPPTPGEQMQLVAARLERRLIVIMPHKCKTMEEWQKNMQRF